MIAQAEKSLFLQIYGCTDPHILKELSLKNIPIDLFYDPSGSGPLNQKLPFAIPLKSQGLMHKKIIISDESAVFLGSTNLTPTSLRMHDNLVIGIYSKELAYFIKHSPNNHLLFSIRDQKAEFWHLPDFQNQCLERILSSIQTSSSSIRIALFTFTHPKIIQALIQAYKRGVDVHIAIDFYSSQGASKNAVKTLSEAGIFPLKGQSGKLLHHKWCLIDETTLFIGSANWTCLAFSKNEDCIFILNDLDPKQRMYFLNLWKKIERNSSKTFGEA